MYFERQAQAHGLSSADQAIDRAEAKRQAVQNHMPLPDAPDPIKIHEVVQDGMHLGEKKIVRPSEQVSEVEEINPKVLHLCNQVSPAVPDQQKMSAAQLLQEIDLVSGLGLMDWEYIQSHGYYKTVKNFARRKVAEMASQNDGVEEAEVEAPKPVKKTAKKKTSQPAAE